MRNLITILIVVSIAFTSCHRRSIPSYTDSSDTTVITKKDTLIAGDTTINIPSKEVGFSVMIDSLLKVIKELQADNTDTAIYVPFNPILSDTTISRKHADTSLRASIFVNSEGFLRFVCKEDSLKQVIRNLTVAFTQLYVSKQKTITKTVIVPGPVKIVTQIPKWMWWWFGISLCYLLFKIVILVFTPASEGTSVLKLVTSIFKK